MANRKACYGSNKAFAADMKKMVNNPLLRFRHFSFTFSFRCFYVILILDMFVFYLKARGKVNNVSCQCIDKHGKYSIENLRS